MKENKKEKKAASSALGSQGTTSVSKNSKRIGKTSAKKGGGIVSCVFNAPGGAKVAQKRDHKDIR